MENTAGLLLVLKGHLGDILVCINNESEIVSTYFSVAQIELTDDNFAAEGGLKIS